MITKPKPVCGTSSMIRPRFGPGMLLQHEDLEQIVEYTTGIYRLLFRSLLGCGVVCGLEVSLDDDTNPKSFKINLGIALECEGYVIEVPKQQAMIFGDITNLPNFGLIVLKRCKPKPCATRIVVCSDGDQSSTLPTREFEGFEIEIVEITSGTELDKTVEGCLNPFVGNECTSQCCSTHGVLLASFQIAEGKLTLKASDEDRRNLRFAKPKL